MTLNSRQDYDDQSHDLDNSWHCFEPSIDYDLMLETLKKNVLFTEFNTDCLNKLYNFSKRSWMQEFSGSSEIGLNYN